MSKPTINSLKNIKFALPDSSKRFSFLTGINREVIPSQVTKLCKSLITVQKFWADAFSKFSGNLVPLYQSGSSNQSNALNWMEIMGIKAAKDLSLELNQKNK